MHLGLETRLESLPVITFPTPCPSFPVITGPVSTPSFTVMEWVMMRVVVLVVLVL